MWFHHCEAETALKMLGVDLQSFMSDGCSSWIDCSLGGIGGRAVRSNARCLLQMCLPFAHDTLFPICTVCGSAKSVP